MKRIRPAPMGRAFRYVRRIAHIEIALAETPAITLAGLHAKLLRGYALDALERSVRNGWGDKAWVEHDSDFDAIRQEPRYLALVRAM